MKKATPSFVLLPLNLPLALYEGSTFLYLFFYILPMFLYSGISSVQFSSVAQ